ncbi:MAG: phosphoglycerate kinase [candidate division WOR-3 bacterium]
MKKLSVRDLPVEGRRVFVRVDFNVPLTETGAIRSDARIRAALPTVQLLLARGAVVILGSHLGKPEAKPDPKLSLRPVAEALARLLDRPVAFAPDCIGPQTEEMVSRAGPGSVTLLENLRFHPGETENDPEFCRQLAVLADCYVNDAFGTAHRAHASTAGMAKLFDRPAAGLLMEKEIEFLSRVLESPARPFIALIGGAKTADKIGVIANLLPKVDKLLIGGGPAFTFLAAQGRQIGRSLFDPDLVKRAAELAEDRRLILPADFLVAPDPEQAPKVRPVSAAAIPSAEAAYDIGPATSWLYADVLKSAKTIVWAGPMGMFEKDAFSQGTRTICEAMSLATVRGAVTVAGGGDTLAALDKFGCLDKVSHASTGGSACLEFLEGRKLPGVAVLANAPARRPGRLD